MSKTEIKFRVTASFKKQSKTLNIPAITLPVLNPKLFTLLNDQGIDIPQIWVELLTAFFLQWNTQTMKHSPFRKESPIPNHIRIHFALPRKGKVCSKKRPYRDKEAVFNEVIRIPIAKWVKAKIQGENLSEVIRSVLDNIPLFQELAKKQIDIGDTMKEVVNTFITTLSYLLQSRKPLPAEVSLEFDLIPSLPPL